MIAAMSIERRSFVKIVFNFLGIFGKVIILSDFLKYKSVETPLKENYNAKQQRAHSTCQRRFNFINRHPKMFFWHSRSVSNASFD